MQSQERPSWMREGKDEQEARGSREQPRYYVTSDLNSLPATRHDRQAPSAEFPRSVITGVKIIAWLMLLNTSIGVAFLLTSLFPPRGTEIGFGSVITAGDYFTVGRILTSLVVGVLIATGVWVVVDAE